MGFYDWDGDGLNMAHSVGLWNSSGTLLASALVDSASRLEDFFRYTDVAPFLLDPGTYTLGATSGDGTDWVKFGGSVNSLTTIPEITSTFEPLNAVGASLARPINTGFGVAPGFFGPNLDVTVEVPELDPSGAPPPALRRPGPADNPPQTPDVNLTSSSLTKRALVGNGSWSWPS